MPYPSKAPKLVQAKTPSFHANVCKRNQEDGVHVKSRRGAGNDARRLGGHGKVLHCKNVCILLIIGL